MKKERRVTGGNMTQARVILLGSLAFLGLARSLDMLLWFG